MSRERDDLHLFGQNIVEGAARDLLARCQELDAEIASLKSRLAGMEEAMEGLLDGLDENRCETGGLSEEQWERRIDAANEALAKAKEKKG